VPTLLVVDDDALTLDCFRLLFPEGAVSVLTAETAAEGLRLFSAERPDVVVLDVRLPDLSGLEAFRRFHDLDAKVPIILITGHGTAETAIEAMRLGSFEYAVKPLDPAALRAIITRAFEISRLMRVPAKVADVDLPQGQSQGAMQDADVLVGNCPAMREVYKAVGRVADQDVTVLIRGGSGTGKELVARAIYNYSKRSKGPFLAVNCAAIPETLLESELFGHERGAFTGADRKRIGTFEQCHGGTLFLDEIGDMTPLTQAKILRVLQDKQFQRVGGNELIKADVRIVAATHRNLEAMIEAGEFRRDLYYRLSVYVISLPLLRERDGDLTLLAEHFVRKFSRGLGRDVEAIAPATLDLLQRYSWPGNVRELQSVIKQTILQARGPLLLPEFLPALIRTDETKEQPEAVNEESLPSPGVSELERFIEERLQAGSTNLHAEFQAFTERRLLLQVLRHVDNNLTQAARILGISRVTARNKLGAVGISIGRSSAVEEDGPVGEPRPTTE